MKHQATIQPRMETYRTLLKQNTFLSGAAEECLKQLCAPEDQIYVTLWAPALVQYVAWVLEEAQKNRQKRLYFLARDAYPMYLVAKKMVEYIAEKHKGKYSVLQVGTGDSPLTVPFYEKCGFVKTHSIKNFFIDNYDHPIYECGVRLTDMIYLQRAI